MAIFSAKSFLANLTTLPGIYQMINIEGKVIYVGKARNLKKRLLSYFQAHSHDNKTQNLINQITDIKVTITRSENEALLLESELIRRLKPHYNILLKDDKSFPYLFISSDDFPRIDLHRGPKKDLGHYFGPYPGAGYVRETIAILQRLFKIRQCTNSFFRARTRPCLQYQIKRCSAPCVGYISKEQYEKDIKHVLLFLDGKDEEVIQEITKKMQDSATNLDFEEAAKYRDQLKQLRKLQQHHTISAKVDMDIIAVVQEINKICVQILFIRDGKFIGGRAYFPKSQEAVSDEEVLTFFLTQHYLSQDSSLPRYILPNIKINDSNWLQSAISEKRNHKLTILKRAKKTYQPLVQLALTNASQALSYQFADKMASADRTSALQQALQLPFMPQHLECFDISHTQGEETVASCVVFNAQGPDKKGYRRFLITGHTKGDDYAAMKQALTRRYQKLKASGQSMPDIVIVDGGKGQLSQVEEVFKELELKQVLLLAIAKGPSRKPGLEQIFIAGQATPVILEPDSKALHLLQHIRDEAHRFAISYHRKRRGKRLTSPLQQIPGIGPHRRRKLLLSFGGFQEIMQASVEDIAKVPGFNMVLATRIFRGLHEH